MVHGFPVRARSDARRSPLISQTILVLDLVDRIWDLRRMGPSAAATMASLRSEGVVTLADQGYFAGLETLYQSVQTVYPVPVLCFDIGLSDDQKALAKNEYEFLTIVPVPDTPQVREIREAFPESRDRVKSGKRAWPLWLCPFLIASSPFRRVFWLDCDIVVLRELGALYHMLEEGPVFTTENHDAAATPNRPELYEHLPIERPFNPGVPAVNAGVSGWDLERDHAALQGYMYPVIRACRDPAIRDAISWHDQGALIWSIQRHGLEHRVLADWKWNLCVRHTSVLGRQLVWGNLVVDGLRRSVPDANLLHWNGVPLPWK